LGYNRKGYRNRQKELEVLLVNSKESEEEGIEETSSKEGIKETNSEEGIKETSSNEGIEGISDENDKDKLA
jgi:hypothetical protein